MGWFWGLFACLFLLDLVAVVAFVVSLLLGVVSGKGFFGWVFLVQFGLVWFVFLNKKKQGENHIVFLEKQLGEGINSIHSAAGSPQELTKESQPKIYK